MTPMTDPAREEVRFQAVMTETSDEWVICPWCGDKQGDAWEWVKDEPEQEDCQACGKRIEVYAEHTVTYVTRALAPMSAPTPTNGGTDA